MDCRSHGATRRFLVVAENVVIAEDLREILAGLGSAAVDVYHSLVGEWAGRYDAAFLSMSRAQVLADDRVRALREAGTRLFVLDDLGLEDSAGVPALLSLCMPFRTEDVLEALERAGFPGLTK